MQTQARRLTSSLSEVIRRAGFRRRTGRRESRTAQILGFWRLPRPYGVWLPVLLTIAAYDIGSQPVEGSLINAWVEAAVSGSVPDTLRAVSLSGTSWSGEANKSSVVAAASATATGSGYANDGLIGVWATAKADVGRPFLGSSSAWAHSDIIVMHQFLLRMVPDDRSLLGKSAKGQFHWNIEGSLQTYGNAGLTTAGYSLSVWRGRGTQLLGSAHGAIKNGVVENPPDSELTARYSFTWGETLNLWVDGIAEARVEANQSQSGGAEANYSNTFTWGGITVTDMQNNPITGFQALDPEGRDWSQPVQGPSVPEPSAFVLAAVGVLGLVTRASRARRSWL